MYILKRNTKEDNAAQNCSVTNIPLNIFLCVQRKYIYTGLEQLQVSKWQNFNFGMNYTVPLSYVK